MEAKIKDRHDKVLSDETTARLLSPRPLPLPTFDTPFSPRLYTTGTRGFGFTGEMLDLLDRDTRGRDPPHPPFSAPRCSTDVDLTVRLRTCVEALPASHLNLNLKARREREREEPCVAHAHAQSIKVDRRRRRHILTELSSRPFVVLGIEGRGYREFDRRRRMMIYGRKGRKERRQIGEKKGEERETETRGAISGSVGAKIRGNCCSSLRADQQARDRNDLRGRSRVPIDRVTRSQETRTTGPEGDSTEPRAVSLWELGVVFTVSRSVIYSRED